MICGVCGKTATGINYGISSCEGCKAFYRRGLEKKLVYYCSKDNSCVVKQGAKGCCKACRFRRCKDLGMNVFGENAHHEWIEASNQTGKKHTKWKIRQGSFMPKRRKPVVSTEERGSSELEYNSSDSLLLHGHSLETSTACNGEPTSSIVPWKRGSTVSVTSGLSDEESSFRNTTLVPDNGVDFWVQRDQERMSIPYDHLPSPKRWNSCDSWSLDSCFTESFTATNSPAGWTQCKSMIRTAQSVATAVDLVFGDQILRWDHYKERFLKHGEIPGQHQPETTLDMMKDALDAHNRDNVARIKRFATMLPGLNELDLPATRSITAGWKWVVFWTIHHSAYLTRLQTYITVGPQQLHYCRYWQELMHDWPLIVFVYKFCGDFEEMGLTQTEKYLLLAVVMFEPDAESRETSQENALRLESLHQHYTDVLFDVIKRRCGDREITLICRRLDQFFSALKKVYSLHRRYIRAVVAPAGGGAEFMKCSKTCVWWNSSHEFKANSNNARSRHPSDKAGGPGLRRTASFFKIKEESRHEKRDSCCGNRRSIKYGSRFPADFRD